MASIERFEANLEMSEHPYVIKLNNELEKAINQIMEGKKLPLLKIILDDQKLENNP